MPVSPARAAAFDILLRVEQGAAYASELLHAARYAKFSPADQALATQLVMGVLRWRSLLDHWISQASSQKLGKLDLEVLIAIRIGIYQMRYLERIPPRAAINESVELVKRAHKHSAASFANAVLRKLTEFPRRTGAPEQTIQSALSAQSLSQSSAHPPWLVERWIAAFGFDATKLVCLYNQSIPEATVHLRDVAAEKQLRDEGIHLAPGKLVASARRVLSGDVTRTKAFAGGRVAIQDEASQLIALLVGKGSQIMDCCAAPGGKTSIIAERNPEASIIAAELHPGRARLLRDRVSAQNVHVLAGDVRKLPLTAGFDRVLADVPCSGTGTLARHPEIKWRLRAEDLRDLHSRQMQILQSAMARVVSGGRLVYSTCSLEPEENSQVVENALASDTSFQLVDCQTELEVLRHKGDLLLEDSDSILTGNYLQILPGSHATDGFFAAILQKAT